ncbi:MAG: class I SAM-dependent methyltransferase, partial [Leptospiraceae bacterium]|nr:class I SAM-dependent methyltransferase [Leptospiraceae bacterium]
ESFSIDLDEGIKAKIKLTPFGHLGIFPEQKLNWNLLLDIPKYSSTNLNILNLFAYSGISTLYAAKSGMNVCHVDSSKGMVDWARENAELSGLSEAKTRWIVEDVAKFIKREIKRGKKYQGFILDPPSFGRGSKGEIWKIENDLLPLMEDLMSLCDGKPEFIIISCHTTGFSPIILERILKSLVRSKEGFFLSKELFIRESTGENLAGGFCGYYFNENYLEFYEKIKNH